jgi:hypothetical protein
MFCQSESLVSIDQARTIQLGTNQEHNGNVQTHGNGCVGKKGPEAKIQNLRHGDLMEFHKHEHHAVHESTGGREVVERNEGRHLKVSRVEETLNHGKSGGFAGDSGNLDHEAKHDELDFTQGGNDNTNNNNGDVGECAHVWWGNAETPGHQENSDRCGCLYQLLAGREYAVPSVPYLEHLNECDGEEKVGGIAKHQAQAEKDANGDNCA